MNRLITFIFLYAIILITPSLLLAQEISSIDFRNLNADDLSDAQITQIYSRATDQGLSIQELEELATARGMSPSEVAKLRSRFNNIEYSSNTLTKEVGSTQDRLRNAENESNISRTNTPTVPDTEVPIFGSNLFNNRNLTFEPSQNIPTPKNYVLGAGDELIIDIYGAAENNYSLTVSPDGLIQISNIGPIAVSGLTIEDATRRIISRLSSIYSGLKGANPNTFAKITLGNIRSIKVHILGEVTLPGTFNLSSLSTVFNALYVSGGPSKNGTYRSIKVIRGNEVISEVDVYDFLVDGNQSGNIVLQDQDIIKIDPYINRISLSGEVKIEGLFETKTGETIEDILTFSGGFNEQAYKKRIKIRRNTEIEKSIVEVIYPEESNTVLESGDEITIGKILERFDNRIQIQGAVFREGEFQLEENPTLMTLIENADGLMGDAYLKRALIYRTNPDFTVRTIPFNIRDLLNDPEGKDIKLVKDDIIKITSIFDLREEYSVDISGQINNGGTFYYFEDMTIKDLIYEAGGFSENAAVYNIEVARRIQDDGSGQIKNEIAEVFPLSITDSLSLINKGDEFKLQPFDQVFVRKSPTYESQRMVTITGQVLYPGTYVIESRNFKISDLVSKAGGLTDYAYVEGASLSRDFTNLGTLPKDSVETFNQVGIKLGDVLNNPRSEHNLLLVEGDLLNVPIKMETVNIQGEVLFPINVRFDNRKSFKSYLNSAGGFSDEANKNKTYIRYANGEVARMKKFLFFKTYPEVTPGSIIFVPQKPVKPVMSSGERIAILSTIVSMAAIVTNTIFQIRR